MTTTKIVKSFSEKTSSEIEREGGTTSRVTWENLRDSLGQAVGLSENEKILGIVANEDGIYVRIGYKK